jgi:RNA polymerase sigma-70 factor (ECF subfamily)
MTADEQQAALDLARAGDSDALGRLLDGSRSYIRLLVRSLRRGRVPGRLDDSDLIQDALVEAHRSFARFHGTTVAEFTAWLRAVVVRAAGHTLRAHLTAGKRDVGREEVGAALAEQLADSGSTPSEQAARHELAARMADALARLPEDMQQVLLGRHVDGLSHAALAQQMGRSEGAVRVLYTRALRRLREECGEG